MRPTTPIPALPTSPEALAAHPYAGFLGGLQKPGRYLGGEEQQIVKDRDDLACRFVLAFPDLYEVGMSHLGTRILYDLVNGHEDLACERAFSPWFDLEQELRARDLPLVSLETYTPLRDFDVVGVSLQYELSYSNVLLNLELGGIPIRTDQRGEADPIVIGGGPTATHPEPIAPFLDALLVGEAEEVLPGLLRTVGALRRAGAPRAEMLAAMARIPGVYVPSLYAVELDPQSEFLVVTGRTPPGEAAGAPAKIGRVWVRDLDAYPFPRRFPVPYAEAIFDRASVEITRGCTEGCRFCQAGMIYRPVRERSPEQVVDAVLSGVDNAGYADTSLTALSTADVSCIDPLIKELVPRLVEKNVSLGVASLRAYGLNDGMLDEIKRVGINGLTFAPEAGTQRMRDVINKNVSEDDILASAKRIFERGYDRMKIYFIMGLPTETDEDVAGIIETGRRCRNVARDLGLSARMPTVTVSVSQHVPKPHTPFQWAAMDSMEDLESKCQMLRGLARRAKLALRTHDVRESWLECLFARGDRRMADVLETAYRNGARFDGWREGFQFERWIDALEAHQIRPELFTRTIAVTARTPWDHIDVGLDPGFLAGEWRKAVKGRVSPPCGKPFGAKVHHATVEEAEAEARRLVCYDCGVACDMTQMREERLVSLRSLSSMTQQRVEDEERRDGALVAPESLVGRLATSNLARGSAFKANAEAPHSRLRLVFAKREALRFLGHLDLVRTLPRMFRRAGIELGFTRGYNPQPRMTFTPALPLGMAADAEVVDVEVVLPESVADMTGELGDGERERLAGELRARLERAAPPGLVIREARLLGPEDSKIGKSVAAADYSVELDQRQAERLRGELVDRLEGRLVVTRKVRPKKRRRRGPPVPEAKEIDVSAALLGAELDADRPRLKFRLRLDGSGGARPREVVEALTGEVVPDPLFRRERVLMRDVDDELVQLR